MHAWQLELLDAEASVLASMMTNAPLRSDAEFRSGLSVPPRVRQFRY